MSYTLSLDKKNVEPFVNRISNILVTNGVLDVAPIRIRQVMAEYIYYIHTNTVCRPNIQYLLHEYLLTPIYSIPTPVATHLYTQVESVLQQFGQRVNPYLTQVANDVEVYGNEIAEITFTDVGNRDRMFIVIDTDVVDQSWGGGGNAVDIPNQQYQYSKLYVQ